MKKKSATTKKPVSVTIAEEMRTGAKIIGGTPSPNGQPVSEEEIRLHAYKMWEAAGKPSNDGIQFWLEAEKELKQGG